MSEGSTTPYLLELTRRSQGLVVKMSVYTDIDEGRDAARRLAESRGRER